MIFERALRRELTYTTGAVFLVFLTVMLTTLVIRILGFAASGAVNPADVLVLIGLASLGYLAVLLMISVFVAILIVLTRWYKDSEMVVWFSSGLSLRDFVGPVLRFSVPLIVAVAALSFVGWPWANAQSARFKQKFEQRDDVALVAPGQFRESASSQRVFFIETISATASRLENIFIAHTGNGRVDIAVARSGHVQTQPDGDRYVVLDAGRRYDGDPGTSGFKIVEFDRYGVKIEDRPALRRDDQDPPKNLSTPALLARADLPALGEIVWRLGLPLLMVVLILTAIPLAYLNPRHGRYSSLIAAVLFYLLYSNLLSLFQAWVAQGRLAFALGWWPLHLAGLLIAGLLFDRRIQPLPLWRRLTRRFGGAR